MTSELVIRRSNLDTVSIRAGLGAMVNGGHAHAQAVHTTSIQLHPESTSVVPGSANRRHHAQRPARPDPLSAMLDGADTSTCNHRMPTGTTGRRQGEGGRHADGHAAGGRAGSTAVQAWRTPLTKSTHGSATRRSDVPTANATPTPYARHRWQAGGMCLRPIPSPQNPPIDPPPIFRDRAMNR